MKLEQQKQFVTDVQIREKKRKIMLTILMSATDYPTHAYLDALNQWVDGKITLEELNNNVDKGLYLEEKPHE